MSSYALTTGASKGMMQRSRYTKALKGLFAGKAEIIPGALNVNSTMGARLLPKAMIERIAAGLYKTK